MASISVRVTLISGRCVQISVSMDCTLKSIKLQAQRSLQTGLGVLLDSKGQVLDDCETAGAAGLKAGDTLTLQVRQTMLASCKSGQALAATMGNGSVVAWGHPDNGGDCSSVQEQLRNVQCIQANGVAFAAVLNNGSVVTWGHPANGGDSSAV